MSNNEILVFLLGALVLAFIVWYRAPINRLPGAAWLLASFLSACLAWAATIVEELYLPDLFNTIEHLAYLANGSLLLAWCWFGVLGAREDVRD